ncbi:MAG: hypothetical protein ACTSRS_11660 [Candidatus Helarchaeota archaeon]
MKKRTLAKLAIICSAIFLQFVFLGPVRNSLVIQGPADVDLITTGPYTGNYLVTDGMGSIKVISPTTHEILWQTDEPKN